MGRSLSEQIDAELADRLARLRRRDRPLAATVPVDARVFDRVAPEFFEDLAGHRVRSPEHSVTLERLSGGVIADAVDALLVIDQDGYRGHHGATHGVIYFTAAQVASCRSEVNSGTYALRAAHEPYDANYAHGNIETLRDGERKAWPNGVKKKLKADLLRFVLDEPTRQIAIAPDVGS